MNSTSSDSTYETPSALAGIRVIDFSRVLAGPYCTMLLADLGASVIKVENPDGGDDTRRWGPPWLDSESAYFLSINRNKRSLALNLKHPRGIEIAHQLISQADVLVENFKVGGMAQLDLDYETLHPKYPRLVYCSISGYGQTGPDRDRPGYDFILQAEGGLMSITGEPGRPHRHHLDLLVRREVRIARIVVSLRHGPVVALVAIAIELLVSLPVRRVHEDIGARDGRAVIGGGLSRRRRGVGNGNTRAERDQDGGQQAFHRRLLDPHNAARQMPLTEVPASCARELNGS